MLDLFLGLKKVIKRRIVHIDNTVFRLHWLFTSIILISCSLIVTSRQYVGDPIDCLQTDNIAVNVLNTYCWIHSTYAIPAAFEKIVGIEVAHPGIEANKNYIDFTEASISKSNQIDIPISTTSTVSLNRLYQSNKYRKYYTYYQWVCFALFIQAILFYLPYYIWKLWEGGLLQAITVGMQMAMLPDKENERKRKMLNEYLYSHLKQHKLYAYKYFFCEFLCLTNVTCQFFLTDWLFDGQFLSYGFKVLRYVSHDETLKYDPMIFIFPRMTKCTFHTYGFSGDVQRHDALCMLPLNVVNEKIYIFIWFWMVLLLVLLIWVLIYRLITLIFVKSRAHFLKTRCSLSLFSDLDFICQNSNIGDWFLFYMLGSNLDPLIMRDITNEIALKMQHENKINLKKKLCSKDDENDDEKCSNLLIQRCNKSKILYKNNSKKKLYCCKWYVPSNLCQKEIEFNDKNENFSGKTFINKIKEKKLNKTNKIESSIDEVTFTNYSGIGNECQNNVKYSCNEIQNNLDTVNSNELATSSSANPTIDSNASTLPIDETTLKQYKKLQYKKQNENKKKRKFYRESYNHRNWKRSLIGKI